MTEAFPRDSEKKPERENEMKRNYAFFQNRDCEFFPCHKCEDTENFNCLFCYCPLYFLDCPGNFCYTVDGIKDCSNCLLPHRRENYDFINNFLIENIKPKKED